MLFYFTDIMVYMYLCTFLCAYILLLLLCFACSLYIRFIRHYNIVILSYNLVIYITYNFRKCVGLLDMFGKV